MAVVDRAVDKGNKKPKKSCFVLFFGFLLCVCIFVYLYICVYVYDLAFLIFVRRVVSAGSCNRLFCY